MKIKSIRNQISKYPNIKNHNIDANIKKSAITEFEPTYLKEASQRLQTMLWQMQKDKISLSIQSEKIEDKRPKTIKKWWRLGWQFLFGGGA